MPSLELRARRSIPVAVATAYDAVLPMPLPRWQDYARQALEEVEQALLAPRST